MIKTRITVFLGFIVFYIAWSLFAQPPKRASDEPQLETIEKCRAYRDAWNASAIEDQESLTVRQLIYRSDQMFNCGAKIDGKPFKEDMSSNEALKICIEHQSYAVLSSSYVHAVIHRLTWFLEKKGLSVLWLKMKSEGVKCIGCSPSDPGAIRRKMRVCLANCYFAKPHGMQHCYVRFFYVIDSKRALGFGEAQGLFSRNPIGTRSG